MEYLFRAGAEVHRVSPRYRRDGGFDLCIDDVPFGVDLVPDPDRPGAFELRHGSGREPVWIAPDGDRAFIHLRGRAFEVAAIDPVDRARAQARVLSGDAEILAPMPGMVVELAVDVGQSVEPGQVILVIESMKLQTSLASAVQGRVAALPFAVGAQFEQSAVLARIEAPAEPDEGGTER